MTQQAQNSAAGAQPRDAQLYWLGDLLPDLIADNEAAIDALKTGQPRGPQTGIATLDKALGGYLAPGLHLLQASPGAGKTAMALQIASDCKHPALYVSAEMPTLELFKRLIARQTSTFLGKLNGQIASHNLEDLARQTIGKLPHLAIMDAMAGMASVDLIRQTAEAICAATTGKSILIVLDSLHVWARGLLRGLGSDYEIISEGTRCATELAALLNAPILAICHRNREGNKSGGGLHTAKGSGDLEYEAWTVLDLHRKMEDREDSNGEVEVKAHYCKNRSRGLMVAVELKFSGRLQSFRDA
jgi:replicative DNA helicase